MRDFFVSHIFSTDTQATSGDVQPCNTYAGAAAGIGVAGSSRFADATDDVMASQPSSAVAEAQLGRVRSESSRVRAVIMRQLDCEATVAKQAAAAGYRRCVARGIFAAWRPFAASRRDERRYVLRQARDRFAAALFAVWRNTRAARRSRDARRALAMIAGDCVAAAAPLASVQFGPMLAVPMVESQLHLLPTSRAFCYPPFALTWTARRQRILYLGAAFACHKGRGRRF
jgi:hypothetical protein